MSDARSPAGLVVCCALGLAALWAGLRRFEDMNLYFPDPQHYAHPGTYGLAYEDLVLESGGGRVHAWFIPGPRDGAPVLVVFHGNGGNISNRLDKARAFRAMGFSVLLFDYRGYGKSPGRPKERFLYADGEAAAREALRRAGGDPRRVAYYGESLGCAAALETALRLPPAALVLDSPFTSVVAMAHEVYPRLPARWLVTQPFDNLSKVAGLSVPLLVLHSPQDEVIPWSMGRMVYATAPGPKEFVNTQGGHNEGWAESPAWEPAVRAFLARVR